jgi:hypothetical protein
MAKPGKGNGAVSFVARHHKKLKRHSKKSSNNKKSKNYKKPYQGQGR